MKNRKSLLLLSFIALLTLSAGGALADEEINLSSRGIEQAKRIGEAFRAHGIAVREVLTSPYCRCIDTGKPAFGLATPVRYLRPPGSV
jgi:broad specificity phosphatase PhoE